MTAPSDLLPCPFCGGPAALWMEHRVICQRCFAEGPSYDTLDNIEAWNHRHHFAAQPASVQGEVVADIKRAAIDVLWKVIESSEEYDFPDGLGVGIPQSAFDEVQCLFDELTGDDATIPTPPAEPKREVCVWRINSNGQVVASCGMMGSIMFLKEPQKEKRCYCGLPILEQGESDEV